MDLVGMEPCRTDRYDSRVECAKLVFELLFCAEVRKRSLELSLRRRVSRLISTENRYYSSVMVFCRVREMISSAFSSIG